MDNKNLKVGSGKSKWFARLVMLAMGLVLSVGGVLALTHFGGSESDGIMEEVYATQITCPSGRFAGSQISPAGTLHWTFTAPNMQIDRIDLMIDGTIVAQLHGVVPPRTSASGTHNLNNYVAVGANPVIRLSELRGQFSDTNSRFTNWTRTGTLARPTASVSGSTLSWNAVGSATGYQIRNGATVIRTLGNVTSYNLANIPVGTLSVATNHTNINVVATSSAWYWNNSIASTNVAWGRRATLATPNGVGISANNLNWIGIANATHYRIYSRRLSAGDWRFAVQVAHVGAATGAQTFSLLLIFVKSLFICLTFFFFDKIYLYTLTYF